MTKYKDLTGKRFGKLTVISFDREKTKRKAYWICKCECGNIKSVRSDSLQENKVLSCGCIKKEQDRINLTANHSHKMSKTRIYREWQGMKTRCYNKNNKRYNNYGGRGITVCDEWMNNFDNFFKWSLDNNYSDDLTIDRKNNDGNYEPSNCRWVNNKIQCNNRNSNIVIEHNDEKLTLTELSEKKGLSIRMMHARYVRGDRGKRLLRDPYADRKTQKGVLNVNNKITESQAKLIKEKLKSGLSPIQISRDMDISKNIVHDIKRGKTWSWI
jgi:hypothetical protein